MEKERKAYLPIGCVRKMDSQDKMVFLYIVNLINKRRMI